MKELAAYTALVLSVGANIPYIWESVHGKVKPERISWLLFTFLGLTYFFTSVEDSGAVFFTAGELIGPILIFLISLRYGVGGKSKFDRYALLVAIFSFVLLFFIDGTLYSLFISLFIDAIAITLTIRKLLSDPASESRYVWGPWFISSILAIISLHHYTLETLLFPIYVAIVTATVFVLADPGKEKNVNKISKY